LRSTHVPKQAAGVIVLDRHVRDAHAQDAQRAWQPGISAIAVPQHGVRSDRVRAARARRDARP